VSCALKPRAPGLSHLEAMTTATLAPSSTLLIRPATESDYPHIARITVDSYLHAGHFENPDHEYLQFVQQVAARHAAAEILVAERDGVVIGSVTLVREGTEYADIARSGELEFRMLVVDPVVQRSGAGRALLNAVIDRARDIEGVHTVSLTTGGHWAAARALYETDGFVHAPERDWFVPDTEIVLVVYTFEL
jgi:GNAT superfamily N-acetyltransferase